MDAIMGATGILWVLFLFSITDTNVAACFYDEAVPFS